MSDEVSTLSVETEARGQAVPEGIAPLTAVVALLALALFAGAVATAYPPRTGRAVGLPLEAAFVVVPVLGLVFVSRFGLARVVSQLLFLGLFLFSVHAISDVLEDLVLMPAVVKLAFEEVTLLVGTVLLLVGLYTWAKERTEREALLKEREERLRERERRLSQVNERLEILNRVVRHDIENDMAVAVGWAEVLENHVDDPEGRDALRRITRACRQVTELTESTRDLVKLYTEDEGVETHPVDVVGVVSDELEKAEVRYDVASFELDAEPGLDPLEVSANEMLHSVVRNLLNNAVQHNDSDEPTVTVTVDADDETVEVRVADDGPGVADNRKQEIFGKGEQGLDSSGTGIGLFLVRTLVEGFGGAVRVEDATPRGAVFVVELPRADRR